MCPWPRCSDSRCAAGRAATPSAARVIGVAVWIGAVAAASRGSLDKWGVTSWQSGAILAGSVGLGTLVGSRVPRHGWRPTEASTLTTGTPPPGIQLTFRF